MTAEDHVSHDDLIAFAHGDLPDEDARRVQRFVDRHPEAADTVDRYRLARRHMAASLMHDPPADLVNRAKKVFRTHATESFSSGFSMPGWIDAILARLVYDSRLQPLAVRDQGGAIQMTYESPGFDVDLRAERQANPAGPDCWEIMGQVTADWHTPDRIEIIAARTGSEEIVGTAQLDESMMFSIELPGGHYDLGIRGPTGVIVLPELLLE